MRLIAPLAAALFLFGCKTTPEPQLAPSDYQISYGRDADTGWLIARSAGNHNVEDNRAYSNMTSQRLIFWVEAMKEETGKTRVFFVGQRVRRLTEDSGREPGRSGRIDLTNPAWVGPGYKEADLQLRWRDIRCFGQAYFCNQTDMMEITLTDEMLANILASDASSIPIAVDRKTNIDWRIPKNELIAVLEELERRTETDDANA
ncbi:MAG: hypothetical protein CMK09_05530 [Ponticaulis sp.]|nr:hypothetical protein [Ponticaulis sp.]|tara:strand:- start:11675 stop:12283 length:609 start_codon:yes stop_codon:yes gene_type:complete